MMPKLNEEYIQKIRDNFPLELLNAPIWLAYEFKQKPDGTYTKPPVSRKGHTVSGDDKLGVTFDEAIKDGYPGIKTNSKTRLVALDIDDKALKLLQVKKPNVTFDFTKLGDNFRKFIADMDTYMEYSPSKCGLRILMYCDDKSELPGRANLTVEECIGGELFANSGYVTITGDRIAGEEIKKVAAYQLKPWYLSKATEKPAEVIDIPIDFKMPELKLILKALKLCKLNQSERVKKAYKSITGQDYSHYDFWLKIMQACHHYAVIANKMNEMTSAIVEWSKTDEESFISEEDVLSHWVSFSNNENNIKFHTLMKFANLLKFEWPEEAYDKKGNPTGRPQVNSTKNFKYLMDFYDFEVTRDIFNNYLYVKCDQEILNEFILPRIDVNFFFGMAGPLGFESLKYVIWELAQDNGYINAPFNTVSPLFANYMNGYTKNINMLELWLKTPPEELPKDMIEQGTDISKSNLDYLVSCIQFNSTQDIELAKMYFDTFFFEMVMPIYNPERILSQRSFMLILTGPESARKTTFFTLLFPTNLRRQFVTNSTETLGGAKSIRDFSTSLVTSVLVVTDEFEIFYNKKNDSLFKTLVTSDVVDYVPIYEKVMRKEFKNAVLAGTTNKRSLPFEQDSNRRFAFIDVEWIDTSAMEKINWHHFYRQYVALGEKAMRNGQFPWKLSNKIIKKQYEANEQFRAQSNLELILRELFDFDMETHSTTIHYDKPGIQNSPELFKESDIMAIIRQSYPQTVVKPNELKHTLKRLCGKYTHTTNNRKHLLNASGYIENGIIRQSQYTRYVMPPRLIFN